LIEFSLQTTRLESARGAKERENEREGERERKKHTPAPPPIPSVTHSSSAAARRSTPDEEECTARRVIILHRLWGRFWHLHIPAAASVAFSYALQVVGANDHRNTMLRPEITSYWASNFPPSAVPLSRVAAALLGSEILYGTYELISVMYELPEKNARRNKKKSAREKSLLLLCLRLFSASLPLSFSFSRPPPTLNSIQKIGGRSCPISGDPSWFYCTSLSWIPVFPVVFRGGKMIPVPVTFR